MNTALWIVTGLLAAAYFLGGAGKLVIPKAKIVATGRGARWAEGFSSAGVKTIGALEVLAALGLVLPAVLGTAPVLVPLAALGLVLIMIGASVVRFRRREFTLLAVDLVYLALAAFVAWGRLGPAPFTTG
ncbi:DoxX family protein [Saccharothrix sp. HUAS TT1]|uniref:DoxX family protein n=1 Tax=unclassified Saccharothrix TaxID=2593673 RepID=UPI00345BF323